MRRGQSARLPKAVLASLLLVLILVVPLQAQAEGVLEGQVVNATPGGPPVGAGVAVTLHIFRNGSEIETQETTTTADGRYRFAGLQQDPTMDYWVEARYQDAPYSSAGPATFEGDAATITANIDVYESSGDDSTLRLNSVHVIAESFGQVVRISEIHMFSNDGDTAFAGNGQGPSPEATVFIPLPEGAVGLAFSEEDPAGRYLEVDGGVWDTEPVTPGQDTSLVFLSYHVMVTDGTFSIGRTFAYPVSAFNILVTQPGLSVQSERLVAQGSQSFQGKDYEFYVTEDLPAGEELSLAFTVDQTAATGSGMPGAMPEAASEPEAVASVPAEAGQQGLIRVLGFSLAGLAVVAALAYPLAARRRQARVRTVPASQPALRPIRAASPSSAERQALIEELADLEDARDEGRVDETGYEQRRAQIYQALQSD